MNRLIYLLVAFVSLGSPLFSISLGPINMSLYRIVIVITVFVIVHLLIVRDHRLSSYSVRINSLSFYQFFYLLWLLYAIISIIWVESISRWFFAIFYVGIGIYSILLISTFIDSEKKIKKLFNISFITSLFHHFFGWVEIIFNKYFWVDLTRSDPNNLFSKSINYRFPITTFGNQNDYATLVLAGLFISLIIYKNTTKLWIKVFIIMYIISSILLIRQTGSTINLLALFLGIAVLIAILVFDYKSTRFMFYLMFSMALISILAIWLIPSIQSKFFDVVSWAISGPVGKNTSPRFRINMIINGIYFLLKTLGFGVGAGNIEYWMSNNRILTVDAMNMHNWFMEILASYGIIIFISYIIMYIFILRKLYINFKYSKDTFIKSASFVLFAYIIAFIISSAGPSSITPAEWQWVLWGIIIAFIQYTERTSIASTRANSLVNELEGGHS